MRIYTKIVINLVTDQVLEAISSDYEGPLALANNAKQASRTADNPAGEAVRQLWGGGGGALADSIGNVLKSPADDPYTKRMAGLLVDKTRAGYGARGLANSGIAVQGEQDALGQFLEQRADQKQGQAIQILSAGNNQSVVPGKPPTGFMGLK